MKVETRISKMSCFSFTKKYLKWLLHFDKSEFWISFFFSQRLIHPLVRIHILINSLKPKYENLCLEMEMSGEVRLAYVLQVDWILEDCFLATSEFQIINKNNYDSPGSPNFKFISILDFRVDQQPLHCLTDTVIFFQYWNLNSGPCTCQASKCSLTWAMTQVFFALVCFQIRFHAFYPANLGLWSSYICLLSSWDYRRHCFFVVRI
jgi:hypothetical protein